MIPLVHPATTIGAVHLTVSDLSRSRQFYESRLGFQTHRTEGDTAYLGAGEDDLLVLTEDRLAPHAHKTTGLYHFAILVPARRDLAASLHRLATTGAAMQGAADHGVSEALYLADPDGNGIEIYRDRPRTDWPLRDGRLQMGVEPLDFDDLLREWEDEAVWNGLARDTRIGHVHLHVADLDAAEQFYVDVLGFDVMQRYGSSALFVSAGGYHHHVGLNTWAGIGAPPPPPGAIGLRHVVVHLPDRAALDALAGRLTAGNVTAGNVPKTSIGLRHDGLLVHDPSMNRLLFHPLA